MGSPDLWERAVSVTSRTDTDIDPTWSVTWYRTYSKGIVMSAFFIPADASVSTTCNDDTDDVFSVHRLRHYVVIIAEFSIPAESFALADALAAHPEIVVHADRSAAHAPGATLPCIWTTGGDVDGFGEAIADDPSVQEVFATADFDDEKLYHIGWDDDVRSLIAEMIDHEGVILEANANEDVWRLRIRFMSREQFNAFREYFTQSGHTFTLERIIEAKHPRHTRGDVTPAQYEALRTAVELGYYQIPRAASIRDVADALDVSHQTVSERLRRGTENLVNEMLSVELAEGI